MLFLTIPAKRVLFQTVESTCELNIAWAKKLLNACLRRALREKALLEKALHQQKPIPTTLSMLLTRQWPKQAEAIIANWLSELPLNVRINTEKNNDTAFMTMCNKGGLITHKSPYTEHALVVDEACSPHAIPGLKEGLCYIQDIGAQLVPGLLDLEPGMHCLDACAGKGGKTFHMHAHTKNQSILATDIQGKHFFEENRMKLTQDANITWQKHDWQHPHPSLPNESFDRILVDAPCSASGIISRHPEILWKKREKNLEKNQKLQIEILKNVWPHLKPGGLLLYATCSLFQEENTQVMQACFEQLQGFHTVPIKASWGEACPHGRQLFPSEHHAGFYYCLCTKK